MTTVGYGDLVPESPQGRIFGGLLMVLGLGMFSLLTANFSAFLIIREEEGIVKKEETLIEKEEELIEKGEIFAGEEMRAIAKLESIEARLENLERGLSQLIQQLSKSEAAAQADEESPGVDDPPK